MRFTIKNGSTAGACACHATASATTHVCLCVQRAWAKMRYHAIPVKNEPPVIGTVDSHKAV